MLFTKLFLVSSKYGSAFRNQAGNFRKFSSGGNLSMMDDSYHPFDGKNLITNATQKKLATEESVETSGYFPDHVLLSKSKKEEYMSYFPGLLKEIKDKVATLDIYGKGRHTARVIEYFVDGSTAFHGLELVETYKMLAPKEKQTPENVKLAYYLGLCSELVFDSINITDDIFDGGKVRRNKPCWYLVDGVGLNAINDSLHMESVAFYIVRKYFGHLECCTKILENLHELVFMIYAVQSLEVRITYSLDKITMENYEMIAMNYGTNFFAQLPLRLGMLLAGYSDDPTVLDDSQQILGDLSYLYLLQNDYIDCYGDPKIFGKEGRDIQEGKCRWFSAACMQKASAEQKEIMKAHYGRDCAESVAIVKQLYHDLKLPEYFDEYSSMVYDRLMKNIQVYRNEDFKKIYLMLAETCYYGMSKNKAMFR